MSFVHWCRGVRVILSWGGIPEVQLQVRSKKAESTSAHGYRVTRVIFVKSSDGYFALMQL